jgi:hypothetical protein
MIRRLFIRSIGKVMAWPIRRRLWAFEAACHDPRLVQQALLQQIIATHAETAFGRDHDFKNIRSIEDFRRRVPVAPYEYVEPYIARMRRGESTALVADRRVLMFALTSGTTAARKYIPVTPRYFADYRRGWNIWGLKALRDHRPMILRPIVQIVGDPDEFRTEAGIPCGNISGFTAQVQKRMIRWMYCVPACTGRIADAAARQYVALRFGLPKPVGMLLAANPSTLINLARLADQYKESLIRDIADGTLNPDLKIPAAIRAALERRLRPKPQRARELEAAVARSGTLYPRDAWNPERLLIGTWTGGSVGLYLRMLPRYYGPAPIRDLGLVASEGRFTIPISDSTPAGVLDTTTHYFEFIPEDEIDSPQPTVLGADEIVEGRNYFILPTTSHGLYRYDIRDLVRVVGYHHRTPLIQFLSKGSLFSNLTGEKLSEHQVTASVADAADVWPGRLTTFSLAPCWDESTPYYGFFVEQTEVLDNDACGRFLRRLDECLGQRKCRQALQRATGSGADHGHSRWLLESLGW